MIEIAGFDRLSATTSGTTLPGMQRRFRIPGGRDGLAVALAAAIVVLAFLAFLRPSVPEDTVDAIPWWRFEAGTAALLIGIGIALRRWPGLMYPILAFASIGVAESVESAWYASTSLDQPGELPTSGNPAFWLVLLAALARTAVPAAILSLYATAPERRLGRWVVPVAWAITYATVVGAVLVLGRAFDEVSGQSAWAWANELSYQLDKPAPLFLLATLALFGSLRAAARTHGPAAREPAPRGERLGTTSPSRPLLAAIAAAAVMWLPATIAFLGRPTGLDDPDGTTNRMLLIPILAALIAIVVERWSRIIAWSAVAIAFESIAFLPFFRGAADYVAYALTLPVGSEIPLPLSFVIFIAAATIVLLFAYGAMSIALRYALLDAARAGSGGDASTGRADAGQAQTDASDRGWAIRGALVGLALCAWFYAGAFLGSGFPVIFGAGLLPMYAIPVVLGLGAWRRLVPAVAEAETVALRPFRPFRYLETIVVEALTGRAEHRRRAASAERERLATELQAGVLRNLERVASTNAAGATREEIADRLRELQVAIGNLMGDGRQVVLEPAFPGVGTRPIPSSSLSGLPRPSKRELEVMRLVAGGASNDQIARELFLSLKTVESHLRRLFGRYDVTNRTELAVLAVREGWVDAP